MPRIGMNDMETSTWPPPINATVTVYVKAFRKRIKHVAYHIPSHTNIPKHNNNCVKSQTNMKHEP